MPMKLQRAATSIEEPLERANNNNSEASKEFDDDGHAKRTGTLLTASAHIITAVIGSGVLSLAWAMAQLGWVSGLVALLAFSFITGFCSRLLADCYRSPDPIYGTRNYTYTEVVKNNLGGVKFKLCGLAQYVNLVGFTIGYTITTAISLADEVHSGSHIGASGTSSIKYLDSAVNRSNCFYKHGHDAPCNVSYNMYMIAFAGIEIVLSQLPNFHKISWLSLMAAVMSLAYSSIGLGLSVAKITERGHKVRTSITGVQVGIDVTGSEKIWRTFQSLGNIAFAYAYANVLIEIQDTLKSSPPENTVMKKATVIGVSTTTFFYMMCGVLGYAAFGNDAPGNFLTGFGFYDPFWLVDIGNICIAIHLLGAYQVFSQPIYQFVERLCCDRWPNNGFIAKDHILSLPIIGTYPLNYFRVLWRTAYVVVTSVIAMIFPFFNDILGLIGAFAFWPLTVYFPIEMYIVQAKIRRFSAQWIWLNILSVGCLVVSILSACGSVQGLTQSLKGYKPFNNIS